jgi:3-phenylpropionate/trans-cinnamate dioxygenase ferredoxin subunit
LECEDELLVEVARLEELREGTPRVISMNGKEIALALWRGRVHAIRNICPHQTKSFKEGVIRDGLGGRSTDDLFVLEDDPIIACPWHSWEYDLATGRCTVDPKLRVKIYPVTVELGRVLLETGEG